MAADGDALKTEILTESSGVETVGCVEHPSQSVSMYAGDKLICFGILDISCHTSDQRATGLYSNNRDILR